MPHALKNVLGNDSQESAMKTMDDIRGLAQQLRVDSIRCGTSMFD